MLLLSLLACDPFGPAQPGPDGPGDAGVVLRAEPSSLDFGVVQVEQAEDSWTSSFDLVNVSEHTLALEGLSRVWGGDGTFAVDMPPVLNLDPGERVEVPIRFTPGTEGSWEGFVAPSSLVQVELTGEAIAPVARLVASSGAQDPVWVGCTGALDTALLNDGSVTLTLDSLELSGSSDFTLLSGITSELQPGGLLPIKVGFTPSVAGLQSATLTLRSNDPANPETSLTLSALGVPGSGVSEEVEFAPIVEADWVIALDTGPGMWTALQGAQTEVLTLLQALDSSRVDWQISVVTGQTDCHATVDPFLYPDLYGRYDPDKMAPALAYAFNPTAEGSQGLLDLALASVERSDAGDCLDGLLRPGAQLHLVIITNGIESSQGLLDDTLTALRERLRDPNLLRISAVTGQGGVCPSGGQAQEAALATGGALIDLCKQPWDVIFEQLAQVSADAAGGEFSWTLAEQPVPSTLGLKNGARTLTHWTYDAATNTVTVDGDAEDLQPGDRIDASYLEALVCDG